MVQPLSFVILILVSNKNVLQKITVIGAWEQYLLEKLIPTVPNVEGKKNKLFSLYFLKQDRNLSEKLIYLNKISYRLKVATK